jgi:hypothetical protein
MFPFRKRETVPYADPLCAGRHPFQTFLLLLCAVSGLPLLFGVETAGSVEALLPDWAALSWGLCLSVGSLFGLAGTHWKSGHEATALTIERIGLLIVGASALLYAVLVALYIGVSGTVTVLILLAFGIAAISRARDIESIIVLAAEKKHDDEENDS